MADQADDGLTGLRPPEKHLPVGVMPNAPHQDAGFLHATHFQLAVVEFDDQGRCHQDGAQLKAVSTVIEGLREQGQDAITLVFVHGWKHDARSDDENLTSFRAMLHRTALYEQAHPGVGGPRAVYGIFVGWRGLTAYAPSDLVADATFLGRQDAAHRVATGSVRELFGRLRHYRNARLKRGGAPLLAISGHSFGGMIVYSALAQSLIEAASAPADHVIPGFADLVLLANPAIEGARYLPVYDLVSGAPFRERTRAQLPVFICIQAENDQPVGTWFPIGNFKSRLEEAAIGDLEKRCITHAIGFVGQFNTHRIAGPAGVDRFVLDPPEIRQPNPFWVVSAEKEVIDGHGGIWQQPFIDFLGAVLFQHVQVSKAALPPPAGADVVAAEARGGPSVGRTFAARAAIHDAELNGKLADFAHATFGPREGGHLLSTCGMFG